jgi:hypothetical protein
MGNDLFSADWPHDQEVDDLAAPAPGLFHEFWALYPRRQAKADAVRAWAQLKPDAMLRARIANDLRRRTWPTERKYIPLPASYLRGYRWLDEDEAGKNSPAPPANRWSPTANPKRLIPGGMGITCDHEPMCESDLDCYHRRENEKAGI